jgi:hypothetical protein
VQLSSLSLIISLSLTWSGCCHACEAAEWRAGVVQERGRSARRQGARPPRRGDATLLSSIWQEGSIVMRGRRPARSKEPRSNLRKEEEEGS